MSIHVFFLILILIKIKKKLKKKAQKRKTVCFLILPFSRCLEKLRAGLTNGHEAFVTLFPQLHLNVSGYALARIVN